MCRSLFSDLVSLTNKEVVDMLLACDSFRKGRVLSVCSVGGDGVLSG